MSQFIGQIWSVQRMTVKPSKSLCRRHKIQSTSSHEKKKNIIVFPLHQIKSGPEPPSLSDITGAPQIDCFRDMGLGRPLHSCHRFILAYTSLLIQAVYFIPKVIQLLSNIILTVHATQCSSLESDGSASMSM